MTGKALWPLVLLLAYGSAFGWRALGRGLLAFDDHPGQLFRLWHAVALGVAPWRWNPGWWAGYAELQFYPPGFSYAGALLCHASLGALTPETAYGVLLWVALLLPGVATYALLLRVLGNGWLALPGAFLALVISSETRSGLEEGLRWGLVAARLGWGLLPVLGLSVLGWLDGAPRARLAAPILLAAVILVHPAHAPLACAMVLVAGALAPGSRSARARQAGLVLLLGFGLSAFWLVPLLAHLSMALPLAWGDASLGRLARRLVHYPLLGLLAASTIGACAGHCRRPRAERAIAWFLWLAAAALGIVVADAILGELGVSWLPADRVADGLVLALILAASVGLAALARLAPAVPVSLLALAAIGALALSPGGDEPALSIWPRPASWPTYEEVVRGARLDDLWRAVRQAPPGRILFLRSAVPLEYRPVWWRAHSHVTALTPVKTGREIVSGTFTHPSPVAGFVYSGSPAAPITMLAEQRDGRTLFGVPLEALAPGEFARLATALRISAVVALDEDAPRLGFLAEPSGFGEARRIGPFLLHASLTPRPLPEATGPERLRVTAPPGSAAWWNAGIAYSPLWGARAAGGALRVRAGVAGLLEIERPPEGVGPVELTYAPGPAEWAGVSLGAGAAAALLAAAVLRRRRA